MNGLRGGLSKNFVHVVLKASQSWLSLAPGLFKLFSIFTLFFKLYFQCAWWTFEMLRNNACVIISL